MQLGLPVLSWPRRGLPLRLPRRPQILAPGESPPPGGAGLRRLQRGLVDVHFPNADKMRLVLDNLSTRSAGALCQTSQAGCSPQKSPRQNGPRLPGFIRRVDRVDPPADVENDASFVKGLCASGDRSVVADVAAQGQRLERRRPHSDRRLLQPGEVDVSENQIRAPAREALGAAKTDARGRAGDQQPLAMI